MLHTILLILKIIGIVLLCVVGILLLMTACVLFVPVRYRIRLTREEGEDKPPAVVYVKVTWLLHLVNVLVRYPAEQFVRARIFIFTVFRIPKREKKAGKAKESEKRRDKKQSDKKANGKASGAVETDVSADADAVTDTRGPANSVEDKGSEASVMAKEDTLPEESGEDFVQSTAEQEESNDKESFFTKIRQIFAKIRQIIEKIKEFFENIQYTIQKFCDKIKTVSDNIQYYREVLDSAPFRQSVELCIGELGWVLKKLKPDKFEADFIVGMEDPAATGEILAICGMLYPLIGQHVRVVGDFECDKTRIEGQLYIRGRIRAITFLRTAVRIYINKDIKKLIKMLKKEAV